MLILMTLVRLPTDRWTTSGGQTGEESRSDSVKRDLCRLVTCITEYLLIVLCWPPQFRASSRAVALLSFADRLAPMTAVAEVECAVATCVFNVAGKLAPSR